MLTRDKNGDVFNPLDYKGNYSATSNNNNNNTKLVHWPLMGGLLHFFGTARKGLHRLGPCSALLVVPNVTASWSHGGTRSPWPRKMIDTGSARRRIVSDA